MINRVAAISLPADMPEFMRTPDAVREISYLGPEPDRWTQRGLEPELISFSVPDHFMRLELAEEVGPLPRDRYDFLTKLSKLRLERPSEASVLTARHIGTLPWQAVEVEERLEAAFRSYRIAKGEFPAKDFPEWMPLDKSDLPDIEATALFYAGWLGHYIGDGCMPLHTSINIAGWAEKEDPHGYTRNPGIHHNFEMVADDDIEHGTVTTSAILPLVKPAHKVDDPFLGVLEYLKHESTYVDDVYSLDKQGKLADGSLETAQFIDARMSEGAAMLRDLIYTAWIQSASLTPPHRSGTVAVLDK